METNNTIEEAKIIDNDFAENTSNNDDLLARLNTATEVKTPSENPVNAWDFSTEPIVEPVKTSSETATNSETTVNTTAETSQPKISKDLKQASARITVSALDSTQRIVFTALVNTKLKETLTKSFNAEDTEKLENTKLIDVDLEELEGDDLSTRKRFDRIIKKHNKIITDIPFTPIENEDLEKIFYQYMDAKNTTLPPELMLFISVTNVLGKRAIDLFID